MGKVAVRLYAPQDLKQCHALWFELVQWHRELYDDPSIGGPNPGQQFDRHLGRVGPECVWVAEREGRAVGMVALITRGEEAEIDPLIVSAQYRGQGIGRALLERATREAEALGMRYLAVRPVARNRDAFAFYHRAGFRLLSRVELFMDLQTSAPDAWAKGPELFGLPLRY